MNSLSETFNRLRLSGVTLVARTPSASLITLTRKLVYMDSTLHIWLPLLRYDWIIGVHVSADDINHLMSSAWIYPETYQDSSSLTWSPGLNHSLPGRSHLPSEQKYTASIRQSRNNLNVQSSLKQLQHTCMSQMLDLVSSGLSMMFLF